jgi:hypothetical protein
VPIRARLGRVESLFLVIWFVVAAAFMAWIIHEWMDRGRGHRR